MTREEFLRFPVMTKQELAEAIQTAVGQTRASLQRFPETFKHIFSTNGFYTEAPMISGPMASGQGNCGLPTSLPEILFFSTPPCSTPIASGTALKTGSRRTHTISAFSTARPV